MKIHSLFRALALTFAATSSACGDDVAKPACEPSVERPPEYAEYCDLTWNLATEASTNLVLTQADYDNAYAKLWPIWAADEPMLRFACPWTGEPVFQSDLTLRSSDPAVIAALEQRGATGDAALDALVTELPIAATLADSDHVRFTFFRRVGSATLRERLAAQSTVSYSEVVPDRHGHNIVWEEGANGTTIAHVTVAVGSEIPLVHSWDVEFRPDGTSIVIDRGGQAGEDLDILREYALRELPLPPPPPGL